jgi:hypothetical protein
MTAVTLRVVVPLLVFVAGFMVKAGRIQRP